MRRFWENLPLRVKVLTVIAIPVVPLLVSAALVLVTAARERDADNWVRHTLDVKAQLDTTLSMTDEANASVQAFLLTRERASLRGFMEMGQKWPETLKRLVELVRDNPTQVEKLKQIAALQGKNPLITMVQYGVAHPSDPIPPALLAENEATVSSFRGILLGMQSVEDRLLEERRANRRRAQLQEEQVALTGAAVGVIGSLLAAFAFSAGIIRRLNKVRENGDRLADGRELLPATTERYDEIGALARGIRNASALLKAREAELRDRVAELGAVNQELEAFSYSVSHDLRAPLRHITGFATLLESGSDLKAEDRRRLRTISEAATRMGRLIDDLITFSRMGRSAITKRRVRLEDLVAEARKEVAVNGDDAKAQWTIHPLPEVDADPAMLHLVLVNLLGNAMKYTRPGVAPSVEIGANGNKPGEVVVFVRDHGVGFDMQYADKLFGVFQRLHSSDQFEGTGIGLANVRRIIHRHGGRTWAEGAVDAGATFYFSLPQGELRA